MTRSVEDDRHRPQYHFVPPANWMNDPNGLIQYGGTYHLFYQYNPNGAFWGTMHWGHAISEDLLHWRHMPIALTPDHEGPDRDGCYSGVVVVYDGVPTIVYTGVRGSDGLPCLAVSDDPDLARWTTWPGNPVLERTPTSLRTTIFRDHTLWRKGDFWMMGIGSGIEGKGGALLLYRSVDLRSWEYLHPLVVEPSTLNPGGEILSTGWECPDFFFLGEKAALIACDWGGEPIAVSYWTGEYLDNRFLPERKGLVDAGSPFYAPQGFTDDRGRRIMSGWLRESRNGETQLQAGWSGAMSLPRIVTMQDDGDLAFALVPEIGALRGRSDEIQLQDGSIDLEGVPANSMELAASISGEAAEPCAIALRCSLDGRELTLVKWDASSHTLSLDTRESSRDPDVLGEVAAVHVALSSNEPLELRIFVDRSVIEVYANDRVAISGRMYPTCDEGGLRLSGAAALDGTLRIYEMHPTKRTQNK